MKKPISIKFVKTPNHTSRHLTHWTGRKPKSDSEKFNIISQIIKNQKLKLSPCPHGFTNNEGTTLSVPMVCFTETPIEHSIEHCENFGKFGVGFDRLDMIKLGANPVLYIVKERKYYQDKFNKFYWEELQEKWGAQTDVPFEIRNNLSWFLAGTQPYTDDFKGKTREYYSQREWRIIRMLPFGVTDAEIKKWGPINDGFDIGEIKCEYETRTIDGVSTQVLIGWISFQKNSIKNIIVPKNYKTEAIKLIKEENLTDCDILLV